MVAVYLRERGAPRVISGGVKALGLVGSEVAGNPVDVGEARPRQLTHKAGRNPERRLVKARARVVPRLYVTGQAVAQIEDLGRTDGPNMVQANALVDALGEAAGRNVTQSEGVARMFDQVVPADGRKGALAVVPLLVRADRDQGECVQPHRGRSVIVGSVA